MKIIGQIREVYKDDKYSSIKDFINKPIKEKKKVVDYMKKCKVEAVAPAIVIDLINPEIRFAELCMMTDGIYAWRFVVIYYVERYDMELPEEFVEHVLKQKIGLNANRIKSSKEDKT